MKPCLQACIYSKGGLYTARARGWCSKPRRGFIYSKGAREPQSTTPEHFFCKCYETTRSYSTNYPLSLTTAPGANDSRHLNRKEGVDSTRAANTCGLFSTSHLRPQEEMGGGTLTEAGAMRRPQSRWINWGGGGSWATRTSWTHFPTGLELKAFRLWPEAPTRVARPVP
jgi:hypothetical protein